MFLRFAAEAHPFLKLLGKENTFLEANRRKLFAENPPSEEFEKWMSLSGETQKHVKPPV